MIKMLTSSSEGNFYWEVWQNGPILIVHNGKIGDRGEWTQIQLQAGQDSNELMEELSSDPTRQGFRLVTEHDLVDVTLQYQVEGFGSTEDVERRYKIESLLTEALGWTGNGYCDGGDIGTGTMNIFCRVIDVQLAALTIVNELRNHKLLEGAVLVDDGEDNITVLYPAEGIFHIG